MKRTAITLAVLFLSACSAGIEIRYENKYTGEAEVLVNVESKDDGSKIYVLENNVGHRRKLSEAELNKHFVRKYL